MPNRGRWFFSLDEVEVLKRLLLWTACLGELTMVDAVGIGDDEASHGLPEDLVEFHHRQCP
jgi:hypothetical protein